MSRRKWIGLLVAGAVVAAVVWYVLPSRALRGYEAAVGTCVPWDGSKDHTYSTGQGILETEGDRSVTITSVELLDPSEAELLGARVMDSDGTGPGATHGFPSKTLDQDRVHEAEGFVIDPGTEWHVFVGVQALAPGATWDGVRVAFEDDSGRSGRADILLGVEVRESC